MYNRSAVEQGNLAGSVPKRIILTLIEYVWPPVALVCEFIIPCPDCMVQYYNKQTLVWCFCVAPLHIIVAELELDQAQGIVMT